MSKHIIEGKLKMVEKKCQPWQAKTPASRYNSIDAEIKMAAKDGRKKIFGKSCQLTLWKPWWVKNFAEITLTCAVFKINVFSSFTQKIQDGQNRSILHCFCMFLLLQKFKMATKNSRKMIFGKSRQITLQIP